MNERIKQIREAMGLNMREFAERLGITHGAVSLMESGKREVTSRTIVAICKEFHINKDWFEHGIGEMKAPATREQEIAEITAQLFKDESSFRSQLIKLIAQMDADDMEMLRKYAVKLGAISKDQ